MEHAYSAARLLAVNNDLTARQLANDLNALNRQRQQLTAELGDMAEEMVDRRIGLSSLLMNDSNQDSSDWLPAAWRKRITVRPS